MCLSDVTTLASTHIFQKMLEVMLSSEFEVTLIPGVGYTNIVQVLVVLRASVLGTFAHMHAFACAYDVPACFPMVPLSKHRAESGHCCHPQECSSPGSSGKFQTGMCGGKQ